MGRYAQACNPDAKFPFVILNSAKRTNEYTSCVSLNPSAKPVGVQDLKRFFADAQNDRSNSPLPMGEGEVVRAERVTTSGEGKKEILK